MQCVKRDGPVLHRCLFIFLLNFVENVRKLRQLIDGIACNITYTASNGCCSYFCRRADGLESGLNGLSILPFAVIKFSG